MHIPTQYPPFFRPRFLILMLELIQKRWMLIIYRFLFHNKPYIQSRTIHISMQRGLKDWRVLLSIILIVAGLNFIIMPTKLPKWYGLPFLLPGIAILAMVYVVVFPMWFCHWAWFSVVEIFPASIAAIGTLSVPVIGVVSSIVVLNEAMGSTEWTALVLVVIALTVVMMGQGKK